MFCLKPRSPCFLPFWQQLGICCQSNQLPHCAWILVHWSSTHMLVHTQVFTWRNWSASDEHNPQVLWLVHCSEENENKKKWMFFFHITQVSGNISRGHYHTKHLALWLTIFIPPSPQIFVILQFHGASHCIHLNLEFLLNVQTFLKVSVV